MRSCEIRLQRRSLDPPVRYPGEDQANGVAVGLTGMFVAGSVSGVLPDKTSAEGVRTRSSRKYDAVGTEQWTGQFGTAAADSAAGVAISALGLFVAGSTNGIFGTDWRGSQDVFVAKIVDTVSARRFGPSLSLNASISENSTATLNGFFTDPDAGDTHTVVINWGPGE